MLDFRLPGKVNLIIEIIVVVPEVLAIDSIANTEEESPILQIGLINEPDAKVEPVTAIVVLLPTDISVEVGNDFGCSFPIVKGESSDNLFLERKILNRNSADEILVVGGEEDALNADDLGLL